MEEIFEDDPFFSNDQEDEDYDDFAPLEGIGLACGTSSAPDSPSSNKKRKRQSNLRKAPGAPKRFKSSYILFFMAHRDEIKKELGASASVGDVSRRTSERWKQLSEIEMSVWQEKAIADKERYNLEKEKYKGPWQVPYKRTKKNPDAPKRPMSAFLHYSKDKRSNTKEQHPEKKNVDISRLLGQMWHKTSPEEKAPYVQEERTERGKYNVNLAAWNKKESKRKKDEIAKNSNEDQGKNVSSEDDNVHWYDEMADPLGGLPFDTSIPSPPPSEIPDSPTPYHFRPRYIDHSQERNQSSYYEHPDYGHYSNYLPPPPYDHYFSNYPPPPSPSYHHSSNYPPPCSPGYRQDSSYHHPPTYSSPAQYHGEDRYRYYYGEERYPNPSNLDPEYSHQSSRYIWPQSYHYSESAQANSGFAPTRYVSNRGRNVHTEFQK